MLDRASLELDWWIEQVRNWMGGSSKSGTGQVDQVSLEGIERELDRWIERVWNGLSKSGTGQVDRVSLERIE